MLCGQDSLIMPEGLTNRIATSVKQDLILGHEGLYRWGSLRGPSRQGLLLPSITQLLKKYGQVTEALGRHVVLGCYLRISIP